MHEKTLSPDTKRILESISEAGTVREFYLAGGTALALWYGHRISIDLDLFAYDFHPTPTFKKDLSRIGTLSIDIEDDQTLAGTLDGVKISFFAYPYPLIGDTRQYRPNVALASPPDIAVMKLDAIASRATKKDFVDLYMLLEEYSLSQLISFLQQKFAGIQYNETHILKSLTYFEDAADSPMPEMVADLNWETVTQHITKTVRQYMEREE